MQPPSLTVPQCHDDQEGFVELIHLGVRLVRAQGLELSRAYRGDMHKDRVGQLGPMRWRICVLPSSPRKGETDSNGKEQVTDADGLETSGADFRNSKYGVYMDREDEGLDEGARGSEQSRSTHSPEKGCMLAEKMNGCPITPGACRKPRPTKDPEPRGIL